MKHFKKILAIVTVCALCMAPLLSSPITAKAEESTTTYYVRHVTSLNQFRYQKGSWIEGQEHFGMGSLTTNIKDGDHLVIDDTSGQGITLTVNVNLGSLTVTNGNVVNVTANGVSNFYGLNGTTTVINADVTNAYVYGQTVVNFNNNVKNLYLLSSSVVAPLATINVLGTCDVYDVENSTAAYSFAKNTLRVLNGNLVTDVKNYSFTAPATTTDTPSTSDGEYDDVPKTSDNRFNPLWLVGLAAVCFLGSYGVRKTK